MQTQLTLDIQLKESFTFDNYLAGDNQLVLSMLQDCVAAKGEQQLFIWGAESTGKSHLLQAACHLAAQQQQSVSYLPMKQWLQYPLDILQGLEAMDLVCVDDVQQVAQSAAWQEAIFDLINRLREAGKRLVFTANLAPNELPLQLEDLRSRLNWSPVVPLIPLNDHQKSQALQTRAKSRGFDLPDAVATYILNNYSRELGKLLETLDTLDKASLSRQRRLTIPFVKTVFDNLNQLA